MSGHIEQYDVSPKNSQHPLPHRVTVTPAEAVRSASRQSANAANQVYPLCGSDFLRHLRGHSTASFVSVPSNQSPYDTPLDASTPSPQCWSPGDPVGTPSISVNDEAPHPTSAYLGPLRDRAESLPSPERGVHWRRLSTPSLLRPILAMKHQQDEDDLGPLPVPSGTVTPGGRGRRSHRRQAASLSESMLSETVMHHANSEKDKTSLFGGDRPPPIPMHSAPPEGFRRRVSPGLKNLTQQQAASWNEFAYAYSLGAFEPMRAPLFPLEEEEEEEAEPQTPVHTRRRPSMDIHEPFPRPISAPPSPAASKCHLDNVPHTPSEHEQYLHSSPPAPVDQKSSSQGCPLPAGSITDYAGKEFGNIKFPHELRPFYEKNGFLPAPLPPDEPERLKALYSFNILHTSDDVNFDRIVNMIKLCFNTRMTFLSLMDHEANWYKSYSGNGYNCSCMARSIGFCSHVVLRNSDEAFVVLDTKKDWRFKNNPFVTTSPHLRFYAAAPLRTADGHNVGTLALVDDQPRTEFSPRSRHVLKEFAAVVMRELELWRDRLQLRMRDRVQQAIEQFARECLVSKDEDMSKLTSCDAHMSEVYSRAAQLIKTTLGLDGCTILDISQFERVEVGNPDGSSRFVYQANPYTRSGSVQGYEFDTDFGPVAAFPILATTAAEGIRTHQLRCWEQGMVSEFLSEHTDGRIFNLTPPWLRSVYPSSLKYAMAVPVFGIDQHPFALMCAHTHDKGKQFLEGFELQFLRSIGAIILSAVLRRRTVLADRSKNVLISSVSHELRTPLHGMLAAGELLSDTPLDDNQEAFLATLRTCGMQLIETVNHVLDFAKLSKGQNLSRIKNQRVNLAELIQSTMEGCWLGQRARLMQMDENDVGSFYSPEAKGLIPSEDRMNIHQNLSHVESVLDVGFREKGWNVICETGGLRRIVMNLYNNSLKFTNEGYVQIMLRELRHPPDARRIPVELRVVDTGKGIGKDFIKNQLFQPFAQENPLQPGTGLGLAIVSNIVTSDSMGGTLNVYSAENVGTEIRIQFEVETVDDEPVGEPLPWRNRNLGKGYTLAFINYSPVHRGLKLQKEVVTSYAECLGFDFTDDVSEADIVIVNETEGVTPAVAEQCRGKAMLLIISFKLHDKDSLGSMLRTESYTGLVYKPMGMQHFSRCLQAAIRWIGDPTNPKLLGALAQLNEADERRKQVDSLRTSPHNSNKMMEILGHRPSVPLTDESSSDSSSPRRCLAPLEIHKEYPTTLGGPMVESPCSVYSRQNSLPFKRPSLVRHQTAPSTCSTPDTESATSSPKTPTTPLSTLATMPPIDRRPSHPGTCHGLMGFSTVAVADGGVMLASCQSQGGCSALRHTRPPRILVVEDNPINRRVLTALLRKRNFEYTEAFDGCAGLELFKNSPPNHWDVILMDITMPNMDGHEATRAIRHVETLRRATAGSAGSPLPSPTLPMCSPSLPMSPGSTASSLARSSFSLGAPFEMGPFHTQQQQPWHHTKIFALTGLATLEDKRKAFSSGVDGYLVKPVSLGTLDLLFKKIGF